MKEKVIAIDGPSASGKSTVARVVAKMLDAVYVDSGALYRLVAWWMLKNNVDVHDGAAVATALDKLNIKCTVENGCSCYSTDLECPPNELRTSELNNAVSPVAANPVVRKVVTDTLRSLAQYGLLVMEGRDIGTAVFPHAVRKFYLDASPEVRAMRRHQDREGNVDKSELAEVKQSLARRDVIDSGRKTAPLRVADDAIVIDSSELDIEGVVARIIEECSDAAP